MKTCLFRCITIYFLIISTSFHSHAQIDSGFVSVKDGVIFYRIWGEGEPLVFLNGGPALSSRGYEVYAKETSISRKVILFDQRSTGKSKIKKASDRALSMSCLVEDMEALRSHLNIDKWDVFGHSFGGQYAINYTCKHPDKINRLILSATSGFGIPWHKAIQKFKDPDPTNLTDEELIIYFTLQEELKKENRDCKKIRRFSAALKSRYYVSKPENYSKVAHWWLNEADGHCNLRAHHLKGYIYSKYAIKRKLRKFKKPVLIIHGIGDFINISNPINNHKIFPNSELKILTDCGHMMSLDNKEEYFSTINEFLQK